MRIDNMNTPKKYVSHCTSSTTNRGVEVKETEVANTRLDMSMTNLTQFHVESSSGSLRDGGGAPPYRGPESPSQASSAPFTDETASYIQVVVQKHRRRRDPPAIAAVQTSPRLPASSSPIVKDTQKAATAAVRAGCAGDGLPPPTNTTPDMAPTGFVPGYVMQHPVLFTYPTTTLPSQWLAPTATAPQMTTDAGTSARSSTEFKKVVKESRGKPNVKYEPIGQNGDGYPYKERKYSIGNDLRNKFQKITQHFTRPQTEDPERLEVFYFDSCSGPTVCGDASPGVVGRWAERSERLVRHLMSDLVTVVQCALSLPITLFLLVLRCVCILARQLVTGILGTVSQHTIRPMMAAVFNITLAPLLLFLHHVVRGVGEVFRPVGNIFIALVDSATKMLGAIRLVHIER